MSIINNMPNASGNSSINGLIEEYYVYAGENIEAGDLVEFVNGIGASSSQTTVDTNLANYYNTSAAFSAVKINNSTIFIAHSYGYGSDYRYLYGVVITIQNGNIIVGADTELNSSGYSGWSIKATLLESGRIFIAHSKGSYHYLAGMIVTVTGTTITVNSDTELSTINYSCSYNSPLIITLANNYVFIAHNNDSNCSLYSIVFQITGTTIDTSTLVAAQLSIMQYTGWHIEGCLLPNGVIALVHSYGADRYLSVLPVTIEGTAVDFGSESTISEDKQSGFYFTVSLLSNGDIITTYGSGAVSGAYFTLGAEVRTISESLSSITKYNSLVSTTYSGYCDLSSAVLPSGEVIITRGSGSTDHLLCSTIVSVSNRTTTVLGSQQLYSATNAGDKSEILYLDDDMVLILHNLSGYLYGQVWQVSADRSTLLDHPEITTYETQVRKLTTSKIEAVAKTSGEGSTGYVEQEVTYTDNIFPTSGWNEEVAYTKYSTEDGFIIESQNSSSSSTPAFAICDGSFTSQKWASATLAGGTGTSFWIQITCPEAIKITTMSAEITASDSTTFKKGIVQGSNDGEQWTDLYTTTAVLEGAFGTYPSITLSNTDFYLHYRIIITITSGQAIVSEWQTTEYVIKEQVANVGHKDKIQVYVPFTGYNLIPDASFENDQWSGANYSTEVYRLGSRALYFPVGTTYVATMPIDRPIIGHKYYGRRYIKTNGNNAPADCRFEMYAGDGEGLNWVFAWNQGDYSEWGFDSAIQEITVINYDESTQTIIRCFNVNTTADTWVDDLLLVDLTAMFGAGHEPSKEWCDDNL